MALNNKKDGHLSPEEEDHLDRYAYGRYIIPRLDENLSHDEAIKKTSNEHFLNNCSNDNDEPSDNELWGSLGIQKDKDDLINEGADNFNRSTKHLAQDEDLLNTYIRLPMI